MANRLTFANTYKDYSFHRVVFSDEKMFRFRPGIRVGVWRKRGENRYSPKYTTKTTTKSEGVMVWCAMKYSGELIVRLCPKKVKAVDYQDILSDSLDFIKGSRCVKHFPIIWTTLGTLYPPLRATSRRVLYQQDGAPVHRAATTTRWRRLHGVKQFNAGVWPAQSPDLNPIEHVWPVLARVIQGAVYTSRDSLWHAIQLAVSQVDPAYIRKLYDSMPRRLAACIAAKGGHTKY